MQKSHIFQLDLHTSWIYYLDYSDYNNVVPLRSFRIGNHRKTPKEMLCLRVRPRWVPEEYPVSMEKMYIWSLIAIEIIFNFAVILPSTLFWNLTVFTALIKKQTQQHVSNSALQFLAIDDLYGQDCCSYHNDNSFTRRAQILHMQHSSCRISHCIVHYFFCASNHLSDLEIQLQIIRGKKQWNSYGRITPCTGVSFLTWNVLVYTTT